MDYSDILIFIVVFLLITLWWAPYFNQESPIVHPEGLAMVEISTQQYTENSTLLDSLVTAEKVEVVSYDEEVTLAVDQSVVAQLANIKNPPVPFKWKIFKLVLGQSSLL